MLKNERINQVNDQWYIPAVLTGKPDFGAPNCLVRALRYYYRYMTEHPELKKGTVYLLPLRKIMQVRSSVQPRFLGGYAPP